MRRSHRRSGALLAAALILFPHLLTPQEQGPGQLPSGTLAPGNLQEQVIGEVTADSEVEAVRFTKSHFAWVEKKSGRRTVFLDAKQVGVYDDVAYPRLSSDEQHLIFVAKRDSSWFVVLDGEAKSSPFGRLTGAVLSPDGRFYAAGACNQKKCRLLINNEEIGPEFEDISAPRFAREGDRYAYFGFRDKRWVLMLDGKEFGPAMDRAAEFWFSPDGKRVAVAALMNKRWAWVVDGVPGAAFDVIGEIAFAPESKHYAYAGASADYHFSKHKTIGSLVVDGRPAASYDGRGFGGGWQELFGSSSRIVTGLHTLSPDFHGLSDPSYTWDGGLVYAARRGTGEVSVLLDGVSDPPFDDIVSPILITGDARHIAYVGKRGDEFVEVRDHKPGAGFPGKRVTSFVGYMAMTRDGAHLAYEIVRGGGQFQQGRTTRALRRIVLDGKAGREYDAFSLQSLEFSEDARHYFYAVRGAQGDRDLVVFDGLESRLYDDVYGGSLRFIDDRSIEFLARDGRRLLRVTVSLGPPSKPGS